MGIDQGPPRSYEPGERTESSLNQSSRAKLFAGMRLYFLGPVLFWVVLFATQSYLSAFLLGLVVMFVNHAELELRRPYLRDLSPPLGAYVSDFLKKTRLALPLTLSGMFFGYVASTEVCAALGTPWQVSTHTGAPLFSRQADVDLMIASAWVLLVGDFFVYWYHRSAHSFGESFLWRMHTVHHSIPYFTAAHGARAHPLETVNTYFWYGAAGGALGVGSEATFTGAVMGIFFMSAHHVNADTSIGIFRHILVTTEMHRWHHNIDYENAKNYSLLFTFWDKLFGTHNQPRSFDGRMGVNHFPREFPESIAEQSALIAPSRYLALKRKNGTL